MRFVFSALARFRLPGILLGLLAFTAAAGLADTISFNVTSNLLGTQNLQQFDPINGTLTGVVLTLTSTLSGTVNGGGMMTPPTPGPLVPGPQTCTSVPQPIGPPMQFCTPGPLVPGPLLPGSCIPGPSATVNVSGGGSGVTLVQALVPIAGSGGCDPVSFSLTENSSPLAGPLIDYVGTGTLPFTFSATSVSLQGAPTWTGTLQVDYTYTALVAPPAEAPEPSTAFLAATALATLSAFKRRR